jgi:hypothetical protein
MLVRVWITANGRAIPLPQMSSAHIEACIRRIHRLRNWRRDWLPALELELYIRSLKK